MSAFVDGELSGAEMMRVREHIRSCATCSDDLEEIRRLKGILSQLTPVRPQSGLESRILQALDAVEVPLSARIHDWLYTHFGRRVQPASAAVALCAALLVITVGHLPQPMHWDDNVAKALDQPPVVVSTAMPHTSETLVSASTAHGEFPALADSQLQTTTYLSLTPISSVSFSPR